MNFTGYRQMLSHLATWPFAHDVETLNLLIHNGDNDAIVRHIREKGITGPDFYAHEELCERDVGEMISPVGVAVKCGNVEIMNILIHQQAFDPNRQIYLRVRHNVWNPSPLLLACQEGLLEVVKSLVEDHAVDVCPLTSARYSPSYIAITKKHLDIVQYFLKHGMSVNDVITTTEERLLHFAIDSEAICEYLISVGADTNVCDAYGRTPLHIATQLENQPVIQMLLNAGADVNAKDNSGMTPGLEAGSRGFLEILKLLIAHGADPEVSDSSGNSLLHFAIYIYRYDIVHYLVVDLNVRMDRVNSQYQTTYYSAFRRNANDIVSLLKQAGYDFTLDNALYGPVLTNPRTLLEMCCFRIRRLLGRRILPGVDTLPIPAKLRELVKLSYLK